MINYFNGKKREKKSKWGSWDPIVNIGNNVILMLIVERKPA